MKISTNTDLPLELLLLTKEGKEKMINGESITLNDVIDPTQEYVKIRIRQNKDGKEFVVQWNGDNTELESPNCYTSTMELNGYTMPTLVVTIPSGTFNDNGYLWVAIETRENNDKFEDNYQNTESLFEKTEVNYVAQ